MRSKFAAAVLIAVSLSIFVGGTAVPAGACSEPVEVETFTVRADVAKQAYDAGDVARITVNVTRLESKTDGHPAGDVTVVLSAQAGKHFMMAGDVTDSEGLATIGLELHKNLPPKSVDVAIKAYQNRVDVPCVRVDETGHVQHDGFFRIKR